MSGQKKTNNSPKVKASGAGKPKTQAGKSTANKKIIVGARKPKMPKGPVNKIHYGPSSAHVVKRRNEKGHLCTGNGAYRLSGGLSWGNKDSYFRGNLGGELTDGALTGNGAYRIKKNSLMNSMTMSGDVPTVQNTALGEGTVISHREFVKDITCGSFSAPDTVSDFTIEDYNINPGNNQLFPWLATVANNYQEYEFTGMIVELKTTSSNTSTTLGIGSMIMSADYNALAVRPADKQHMENMEYSGSSKPSSTLLMPVECARSLDSNTHLYVVPDSDFAPGDARLYDLGVLHIATDGIPASAAKIAELWVSYEVILYKPKIPDAVFSGLPTLQLSGTNDSGTNPLGTVQPAILFGGSSPLFDSESCFGTSPRMYFPDNTSSTAWQVSIWWRSSVGVTLKVPLVVGHDCAISHALNGPADATTSVTQVLMNFVATTSPGATPGTIPYFWLDNATTTLLPNSASIWYMTVSPINLGYAPPSFLRTMSVKVISSEVDTLRIQMAKLLKLIESSQPCQTEEDDSPHPEGCRCVTCTIPDATEAEMYTRNVRSPYPDNQQELEVDYKNNCDTLAAWSLVPNTRPLVRKRTI